MATPGVVVPAFNVSVLPLHTGPLLPAVGVAGGVGSFSVNGPTTFEGQLFSVTEILLYVPAGRFGIIKAPAASVPRLAVCGVAPCV